MLALLAATLGWSPAGSGATDVAAFAGLPHAAWVGGRPIGWRNVGVRGSGEWFDAELRLAKCLSMGAPPLQHDAIECTDGPVGGGHRAEVTLKVPRWAESAPLVDVTLRQWRNGSTDATRVLARSGAAADVVLTQPWGAWDAFAGVTAPIGNPAERWRATFVGVTWRTARGTGIEATVTRDVERASGIVDRAVTLRVSHAWRAAGARVGAWMTRAVDDRVNPWQLGAGLEVTF